jgi:hypothetical protein
MKKEVDVKELSWYKSRPKVIRQAIDLLPPTQHYRIMSSGKQCFIVSYEEPKSGKFEDVTVTVQKTGSGDDEDFPSVDYIHKNQVFGVKLSDLEPWT